VDLDHRNHLWRPTRAAPQAAPTATTMPVCYVTLVLHRRIISMDEAIQTRAPSFLRRTENCRSTWFFITTQLLCVGPLLFKLTKTVKHQKGISATVSTNSTFASSLFRFGGKGQWRTISSRSCRIFALFHDDILQNETLLGILPMKMQAFSKFKLCL
jgi:hypothetical protein